MTKRIIKLLSVFTAFLTLCVSLSACGGRKQNAIDNLPESTVSGDSKVLVAYFSWSGNGQQMARWIAEETDGDLFRIVPSEPYGEDFEACADRAKNELDR